MIPTSIFDNFLLQLLSLLFCPSPCFSWRSAPDDWSHFLLSPTKAEVKWRCAMTQSNADVHKPIQEWQVSLGLICLYPLHPDSFFFIFSLLFSPLLPLSFLCWFMAHCSLPCFKVMTSAVQTGPRGGVFQLTCQSACCSCRHTSLCQRKCRPATVYEVHQQSGADQW